MFGFKKMDEHADLVGRMADALGVDLIEEMQAGRLAPQELRATVVRCVGCGGAEDCAHFLSAHPDGADHTPAYCRNKDLLETLRGA
ncbi:DUF6455 family protein [Actibacterium lipolyticum]|uniref:DUF6455 domain-containing protein n=1 Tax=Actibacterium lipolyticum TaxID=1524263 RepID=A0A238JMC1_9RHOB|nr:DUF6455 family protein [Actibacterium lipolyticum]SMX31828.1 hypothetical protein COL8621_00619 [Actibacterium lipolyticum]